MDIQLTIDAIDYTNYVVSSSRSASLCSPVGLLDLEMAANLPVDIDPYAEVVFYEDGTKVFTGYTIGQAKSRMPAVVELPCADVMVLAKDFWISGEHISSGGSVIHWVTRFLNMASIMDIVTSVTTGVTVFPGFGWSKLTALDAIMQTLQTSPYQIYADANGTVHIVQTNRSSQVDHTITAFIDYERTISDDWIRNRVVVFGNVGASADLNRGDNPYLLPGEVRTSVAATGQIYYKSTAERIANEMLDEFSEPRDTKIITVEGDPTFELGQIVDFTGEGGYAKADCVLTDYIINHNAETGYTAELVLDTKCRNFWGWDAAPEIGEEPVLMYVGLYGGGVYKGSYDGYSVDWLAANSGLSGDALKVNDLKADLRNRLWLATNGGLYYSNNQAAGWTNITLPEPEVGFGEPVPIAIACSKESQSVLYLLTYDPAGRRVWMYYSGNSGDDWTYLLLSAGEEEVWEEVNEGVNNTPLELMMHNNYLYAGGWCWFPTVAEPFNRIGRNDGTGWEAVGDGLDDIVFDMASDGDNIYAGGVFEWSGANSMHFVARYDGSWHAVGNIPITGQINAIAHDGTDLFAGGIIGGAEEHLYRWNGANWVSMGGISGSNDAPGGVGTTIRALFVASNGDLYAGGNFWFIGNPAVRVQGIAKWTGGTTWAKLDGPFQQGVIGGRVEDIAEDENGDIWIVGDFTLAGGFIFAWGVARWDIADDQFYGPTSGDNRIDIGIVRTITITPDNIVYIGGTFIQTVGGSPILNVAVLDTSVPTWAPIGDGVDDAVYSSVYDEPYLYIGGDFLNSGAESVEYLARMTPEDIGVMIPTFGRTHLIDINADSTYIYAAVLTADEPIGFGMVGEGNPYIVRVEALLADYETIYSYGVGGGVWGGVECDNYFSDLVTAFGDFGWGSKVARSYSDGNSWENIGINIWHNLEVIRPLLYSYKYGVNS